MLGQLFPGDCVFCWAEEIFWLEPAGGLRECVCVRWNLRLWGPSVCLHMQWLRWILKNSCFRPPWNKKKNNLKTNLLYRPNWERKVCRKKSSYTHTAMENKYLKSQGVKEEFAILPLLCNNNCIGNFQKNTRKQPSFSACQVILLSCGGLELGSIITVGFHIGNFHKY